MNKAAPAIIIPSVAIAIIAIVFVLPSPECDAQADPGCDPKEHDSVWSGPIGVTKYEHKLGDNIYFLIRNLQPHESGVMGVFTPNGILYKTIEYDGSKKSDFNQFFFPDTTKTLGICTPEELVGIWKVVFANGAYAPLEFEMSDQYIGGGEKIVNTVC